VQAQTDPEARRLLRIYTRRLESNLVHAMRGLAKRERAAEIAEMAGALIDGLWIRHSLDDRKPDPESAIALVESAIREALGDSHA
jgi:TetR/AcrR family transcriptional regulator, transcriptional repressor of bet genes